MIVTAVPVIDEPVPRSIVAPSNSSPKPMTPSANQVSVCSVNAARTTTPLTTIDTVGSTTMRRALTVRPVIPLTLAVKRTSPSTVIVSVEVPLPVIVEKATSVSGPNGSDVFAMTFSGAWTTGGRTTAGGGAKAVA